VKEKNFDEKGNRRQADREFSKKAEIETEMARQRQECVFFHLAIHVHVVWSAMANVFCFRTAKKEEQERLAKITAGGSKAKIIVPGTPRHTGIGAGARVTQTPRRRVGI
jgi:pre-mRNA-splicing factor ATP-dependent RNA helicase DHX38/PRP16